MYTIVYWTGVNCSVTFSTRKNYQENFGIPLDYVVRKCQKIRNICIWVFYRSICLASSFSTQFRLHPKP